MKFTTQRRRVLAARIAARREANTIQLDYGALALAHAKSRKADAARRGELSKTRAWCMVVALLTHERI